MSVAGMRAVDAIGVVIPETAVLNKEVVASFVGIVAYPCAALEMLHPAIADHRVRTEAVLEAFADLVGAVIVIVPLVINGIEIESLDTEVAA